MSERTVLVMGTETYMLDRQQWAMLNERQAIIPVAGEERRYKPTGPGHTTPNDILEALRWLNASRNMHVLSLGAQPDPDWNWWPASMEDLIKCGTTQHLDVKDEYIKKLEAEVTRLHNLIDFGVSILYHESQIEHARRASEYPQSPCPRCKGRTTVKFNEGPPIGCIDVPCPACQEDYIPSKAQ